MASPVIINSSSPDSIRLPTITPPSLRDGHKNTSSSSPGSPSPSAFSKPKACALKSGSRAQAVPLDAGIGFATVGSLWRESKLGEDGGAGMSVQKGPVPSTATESAGSADVQLFERDENAQIDRPGKLRKPKKNGRDRTEVAAATSVGITFESRDFICNDARAPSHPVSRRYKASNVAARPPEGVDSIREPNLDLSEYAFGVYDLGIQTQAPAAISTSKRSRKKAARSAKGISSGNTVGKGRKRNAKSEAVILNSDDLDQRELSASVDQPKSKDKETSRQRRSSKKRIKQAKPRGVGGREKSSKGAAAAEQQSKIHPPPTFYDAAAEKSEYFIASPNANATYDAKSYTGSTKPLEASAEPPLVVADDQLREVAAPRRVDWTPVKDTEQAQCDVHGRTVDSPSTSACAKIPLADFLGDFGYIDASTGISPVQRSTTGEAVTKRRRIELADATIAIASPRNVQVMDNEAETKQAKKPTGRKKLQTITALATAAYQPDLEKAAEQSTVSGVFASRKEEHSPSKEAAVVAEKPKKPRKPRKKKDDPVNGDENAVEQPKKAKKAKVKFNERDLLTKLHSPGRAAAQMTKQDFLFGTSSQLAVDESPAFIRDMQAAVQASEFDGGSHRLDHSASQVQSSEAMPSQLVVPPHRNKSSIKVPTAPHGTCLSLEQAHRELWCVSSRDDDGGFLRDVRKDDSDSYTPLEVDEEAAKTAFPTTRSSTQMGKTASDIKLTMIGDEVGGSRPEAQADISALEKASEPPAVTVRNERGILNPSSILPEELRDDAEHLAVPLHADGQCHGCDVDHGPRHMSDESTPADFGRGQNRDSWMLLSSDDPEPCGLHHLKPDVSGAQVSKGRKPSHSLAGGTSPRRGRSVLRPLDANAALPLLGGLKDISTHRARALSTTANDSAPKTATGRPRGRPRKDTSVQNGAAVSPKTRGRPPKRPEIVSDPSPEGVKFKKPKAAVSASQPLHSPSGWLDVDEISDSDSAVTPSPPRRRASSSPPAVPALEIAVDGSPLAKLKEKAPDVVAASSNSKPGEAQWPLIREQIFPQISATIKNAPRSTDRSKPSWYQKTLMYDPVTLEELTSWLNEQGLRFPVRKQKPQAKKRGRKKQIDSASDVVQEDAVEWEIHEEPLQAWMVQKWCEEHSVCCVWAGGGWGGRTRH